MASALKQEFLQMLEKDREFRYTVAGYLGLSDILSRLEQHDKKFNEIITELRELRRDSTEFRRDITEIRTYIERTSITLEEEAREVI